MGIKTRGSGHGDVKTHARKGRKRGGRSPGYRVYIETYVNNSLDSRLSCYPEDARKFAMELLRVADECDAGT